MALTGERTVPGLAEENYWFRRHEVVYEFLLSIGVDPATAAIDAEGIEHHVSPQTLKKLKEFSDCQRTRK